MIDREDTEGGGYCIKYNTDATQHVGDTLRMTEAEFVTATTVAEYILPTGKVDNALSKEGFENFKCEIADNVSMKCNKMQLWPAASYSGGFRFESKKFVEAYYYDFQEDGIKRWKKNRKFFLTGASELVVAAASLAAFALAF